MTIVAFCLLNFAFLFTPAHAAVPQVLLSSNVLPPGETLRVEVDGVSPDLKLKVFFRQKSYPCFPVGPNAQRALIGVQLGTDPGRFPLAIRPGGPEARTLMPEPAFLTISRRTYETENVDFTGEKTALMRSEKRESALIRQKAAQATSQQYWEGAFLRPVKGPVIANYGLRRLRNRGRINAGFHKGMDLKAPEGEPVVAANAGVVALAAPLKAHGKTVLINHGQGVMTIYLHMSALRVKPGQKVAKGETLGHVGSTGLSTAPHMHWQVYVHGVPVDPARWMETEF